MPDNEDVIVAQPTNHRDQIAKLVIGALATYGVSKLVEKAYDAALEKYRNRGTDTNQ